MSEAFGYTDFEDEIGESAVIDLPQVTAGLNMAKFKEKARAFLRQHESYLALQRLRRSQALTPTDLDELERMLVPGRLFEPRSSTSMRQVQRPCSGRHRRLTSSRR